MGISWSVPTWGERDGALVAAGVLGSAWAGYTLYKLRRRRQKTAIRRRKLRECQDNIKAVADKLKDDKVWTVTRTM